MAGIEPGQKFGKLIVTGVFRRGACKHTLREWYCRCECGGEAWRLGVSLKKTAKNNGISMCDSCLNEAKSINGMTKNRLYQIWSNMISRCHNDKNPGYKDYGGRGIYVCNEWRFGFGEKNGFECFEADMGWPKALSLSLDRVNNDGPYSLQNCRWATRTQQARNQRSNVHVNLYGERLCITEAFERLGLTRNDYARARRTRKTSQDTINYLASQAMS